MQNGRQLLTWLIIFALIAAGIYWYRNRNVTEYKVTVKETVKEEAK